MVLAALNGRSGVCGGRISPKVKLAKGQTLTFCISGRLLILLVGFSLRGCTAFVPLKLSQSQIHMLRILMLGERGRVTLKQWSID
jgi:hypothetical protein